jgi:hypothetical protein
MRNRDAEDCLEVFEIKTQSLLYIPPSAVTGFESLDSGDKLYLNHSPEPILVRKLNAKI